MSYRDEFPVLARKTYLISASLGPISTRSRSNLDAYLDAWATKGAPDHVWFEDIFPTMRRLKSSFAELAGCDPDELAITTNISIALATIASALDFGERNEGRDVGARLPDGRPRVARERATRRRDRVAALPRRPRRSRSRSTTARSTTGPPS